MRVGGEGAIVQEGVGDALDKAFFLLHTLGIVFMHTCALLEEV